MHIQMQRSGQDSCTYRCRQADQVTLIGIQPVDLTAQSLLIGPKNELIALDSLQHLDAIKVLIRSTNSYLGHHQGSMEVGAWHMSMNGIHTWERSAREE